MPVTDGCRSVYAGLADGDDEVVVVEGAAGDGPADVACCAEDLGMY